MSHANARFGSGAFLADGAKSQRQDGSAFHEIRRPVSRALGVDELSRFTP